MNHSNIPTEIQQKLQISLPDQRIEPNDKLTKCIFQMDDEVVKARCMNVVEIRNKDSPCKITTLVTFISELLERFDPHDREVALDEAVGRIIGDRQSNGGTVGGGIIVRAQSAVKDVQGQGGPVAAAGFVGSAAADQQDGGQQAGQEKGNGFFHSAKSFLRIY